MSSSPNSKKLDSGKVANDESDDYIIIGNTEKTVSATLSWEDVKFSVKHTEILKGVSGQAKPNEVLAIMGGSGSGKTSLLSILSNQIFPSKDYKIEGSVSLNSQYISKLKFQTYCRYVMQQDILLPTLTPRESLKFVADLKIEGTDEIRKDLVESMLKKLRLTNVADNIIGNAVMKGISGGEKRRLSIGMELISNPLVIILDEPTSGLDSYIAKVIMKLLKEEAENGKTVIVTIHQPGEAVYEMIDKLILMMSGTFVYQGKREEALNYMSSLGFVIPDKIQPPDFFMRVLHVVNSKNLSDSETEKFNSFTLNYKSDFKLEPLPTQVLPISNNYYTPTTIHCLKVLLKRSLTNAQRSPMLFKVKIAQSFTMSILLSLLFRDLGYSFQQVYYRVSLLFFITTNVIMLSCMSNSITYPDERPVFLKDYKQEMYGVVSYYFSKFFAELPGAIIASVVFCTICYFSCNFNREPKEFFTFFGIYLLLAISGILFGNFSGILAPNPELAGVITAAMVNPYMLFGGYFSNTRSLTAAFWWVKYISNFSRGLEAFVINEFESLPIEKNVKNPIESLGFSGELWHKVGALLLIILTLMIIGLTTLKIKAERSRIS